MLSPHALHFSLFSPQRDSVTDVKPGYQDSVELTIYAPFCKPPTPVCVRYTCDDWATSHDVGATAREEAADGALVVYKGTISLATAGPTAQLCVSAGDGDASWDSCNGSNYILRRQSTGVRVVSIESMPSVHHVPGQHHLPSWRSPPTGAGHRRPGPNHVPSQRSLPGPTELLVKQPVPIAQHFRLLPNTVKDLKNALCDVEPSVQLRLNPDSATPSVLVTSDSLTVADAAKLVRDFVAASFTQRIVTAMPGLTRDDVRSELNRKRLMRHGTSFYARIGKKTDRSHIDVELPRKSARDVRAAVAAKYACDIFSSDVLETAHDSTAFILPPQDGRDSVVVRVALDLKKHGRAKTEELVAQMMSDGFIEVGAGSVKAKGIFHSLPPSQQPLACEGAAAITFVMPANNDEAAAAVDAAVAALVAQTQLTYVLPVLRWQRAIVASAFPRLQREVHQEADSVALELVEADTQIKIMGTASDVDIAVLWLQRYLRGLRCDKHSLQPMPTTGSSKPAAKKCAGGKPTAATKRPKATSTALPQKSNIGKNKWFKRFLGSEAAAIFNRENDEQDEEAGERSEGIAFCFFFLPHFFLSRLFLCLACSFPSPSSLSLLVSLSCALLLLLAI